MLIPHETLKHDFACIFFILLGFKQKLFTRKREVRLCGDKIFCGKESTLAAANKNWPWPSETKEYLLKQSGGAGGAQNWCGIGEQDLKTGWSLETTSCDQSHCCLLVSQVSKARGWGWGEWSAAWLTSPASPWLRGLGGMGTGKGLVFSASLEVYIWIYAMDHCSVVFSPKGNLGTAGKKEMDTKDVYVDWCTATHPHTHTHIYLV